MISDHRSALLPLTKGPVPSKSQSLPTTLAISPLCIILDGTCRWHYLLHNNEVRNVTNQNTRQNRDKLLSDAIDSIFFIIIIYFWGRIVGIFSLHLSAATELKRLRIYCHGRVSSGAGIKSEAVPGGGHLVLVGKIWNVYGGMAVRK